MDAIASPMNKIDALGLAIAASDHPAELLQAVVGRLAILSGLPVDLAARTLRAAAAQWDDVPYTSSPASDA